MSHWVSLPLTSTLVEGVVSQILSDWSRASLSLLVTFALQTFFCVLLFRLSFVSYFLSSSRDLPLPRRDFLFISVSRDHIDHPLLLPLSFSPSNCSLSFTMRPPPSIFPSHLPGFYLSFTSTRLDSTRSLSGNERRNTLATFNRPALSSAYTYLASSAPLYPRPRPHLHPPPSCHPRPSPAYPRQAPTFRFLLLIFTTNIVYKYLRALSLVFRAFCYACLEPVFFFSSKNSKIEICETFRDFTNRPTFGFFI